jgi:hypothetical protein
MYTDSASAFQALAAINVDPSDLAGSQARLLAFVDQLSVEARGAWPDAITVLYASQSTMSRRPPRTGGRRC